MKINIKEKDNIIFDLGGVILDLDFQASKQAFAEIGLVNDQLEFSGPVFNKFQKGEISDGQFRTWVKEYAGYPDLIDKQIDDAWCKMLVGIPKKRVDKIIELRGREKVFLFSNTNGIHISYLERWFMQEFGFSFSSIFDGVAYSHQIKEAKPSEQSFLKIIEIFQIVPARTLFVDDNEENTIGALKAGIDSFWLKPGLDIAELF